MTIQNLDFFLVSEKQPNFNQEFIHGKWEKKGDGLIISHKIGKCEVYNRDSLEFALENVKANKGAYKTYEAYWSHLCHFQKGLVMLNSADATVNQLSEF